MAISREGTLISSGDFDGTVQRWDASTGEYIGEPMEGHGPVVSSIATSDNVKLIVTGSRDRNVRRWDAKNDKAIGKPMEHSGEFWELDISTDGSAIVSGDDDDSIMPSNAETGEKFGDPIDAAGWMEN